MPFLSIPDCAEAVINYTANTKPIATVLGFKFGGAYAQSDIDALAAAVDNIVGTDFKPLMHPGIAYLNTLVRGLTSIVDLSGTDSTSAGVGSAGGAAAADNVAFCITHRTGQTGRSARGRSYMPGLSAANQTGPNQVSSTYATNWVNAFTNLAVASAAVGWTFSVLSRRTGGSLRPTGVSFRITASVARNLIVDSQRHRLPRGH